MKCQKMKDILNTFILLHLFKQRSGYQHENLFSVGNTFNKTQKVRK